MASKNLGIHEISRRIVLLSKSIKTNREFLEICGITNHSLITDLKKGRIKTPGAEVLAQIVKGTGCSGTWLLTGEGEMFGSDATQSKEDQMSPLMVQSFLAFIEQVEKNSEALDKVSIPEDLNLKLAKLLVTMMDYQQSKKHN